VKAPNSETAQRQYRQRFGSGAAYRNRVWRILCNDYFSRIIPPDARILDLGAGWGEFINNIPAAQKFAMDFNPDGRDKLSSDVRFLQQDCSQPWDALADGALDVIFSSNFIEHLPDKVSIESTVAEAHRCLRNGGLFICMGPNIRYVHGAYWDFWDHHIPISDGSCCELLLLAGFSIERRIPRFLPYTMSQQMHVPALFVKAYLRMPFIWKLLGKQFLIIGRK